MLTLLKLFSFGSILFHLKFETKFDVLIKYCLYQIVLILASTLCNSISIKSIFYWVIFADLNFFKNKILFFCQFVVNYKVCCVQF